MQNFEISVDVIAATIAAIGLIGFLYKKVFKPLSKKFNVLWFEVGNLEESRDKLTSIYNELHPNGGGSIKDAVNRIEMRLVQVEQKQNVYLLESPQGIYETDGKGDCTGVNRTYLRMVGKTEHEVRGRGWINCIAGHDRTRVTYAWEEAVKHEMEFSLIYDMIDSNDQIFTVVGIAYPMRHPTTGNILGWLGTINRRHTLKEEAKHDLSHYPSS